MAKSVAHRWLIAATSSEYRFSIFGFEHQSKAKKFASVLRSLRDRKCKSAGSQNSPHIPTIPDLGVRDRGDAVEVWSSNVEALRKLAFWAESSGLNTDFIW
jgi:hypothetical protein